MDYSQASADQGRDQAVERLMPGFGAADLRLFGQNRDLRFWAVQLVGWCAYSLVNFLSITVVDNNVSWPHVGHISLSALLGILTSWPLRPLYRRTFALPLQARAWVALAAIVTGAALWTWLRIWLFAAIVGEEPLWHEYHYWYFGSLFVFLSWTLLYFGVRYYELLNEERQKLMQESALAEREKLLRAQAESEARNAQLLMLRYQLNPHFLFNTLNAVNALVQLRDTERAGRMIQLLSDFFRHTLRQADVQNVSLEQELESLMLYLNIEKTRFQDRLQLEFDIEPTARGALVPGLILQPIVENAMKYAIAPNEEGGTVSVSARVRDDQLQLEVADTGPGLRTGAGDDSPGIGLRNTAERLRTRYAERFSLQAREREPTGLVVQICLPYQLEKPVVNG